MSAQGQDTVALQSQPVGTPLSMYPVGLKDKKACSWLVGKAPLVNAVLLLCTNHICCGRNAHSVSSLSISKSAVGAEGSWDYDYNPSINALESNCTDGQDNDFDGVVDAADPDCQTGTTEAGGGTPQNQSEQVTGFYLDAGLEITILRTANPNGHRLQGRQYGHLNRSIWSAN